MESSKHASADLAVGRVAGALVRAIRPKQWTKNLLVFLALFFTVNEAWDLKDLDELLSLSAKSTLAFVIFSTLTGAAYLVNDIVDIERDRRHPKKRFRPIASGLLPIPIAWAAAAVLSLGGLASGFVLEPLFGWVSATYLGTMVVYTLVLKRLVLLDVFAISAGFILRAVAGAVVLQVPISPWLYVCTGLGALFIALAKRRNELALAGESASDQRDTLEQYSPAVLDQFMAIAGSSLVMAYSLYTFAASNLPENRTMMLTLPFVIYGVFRYIHLVHNESLGESPEDILTSDVPLIVCIAMWLATAATVLVMFRD